MSPLDKDHREMAVDDIEDDQRDDLDPDEPKQSARELYDEAVDRGNRDYI